MPIRTYVAKVSAVPLSRQSSQATKAGAHSVYWTTNEENVTARQLYDRIAKVTPFIKYVKMV